jgi:hypothetical protein
VRSGQLKGGEPPDKTLCIYEADRVRADPRPLLVDEPALSARKDKERKKVLTGGIWALRRVEESAKQN